MYYDLLKIVSLNILVTEVVGLTFIRLITPSTCACRVC